MDLKTRIRGAVACLLAVILLAGSVMIAPLQTNAAAETVSRSLLSDNETEIAIGSEVKIRSGVTTDYYGNNIQQLYRFLTYTVSAIDGDKVTIKAEYVVNKIRTAADKEIDVSRLKKLLNAFTTIERKQDENK